MSKLVQTKEAEARAAFAGYTQSVAFSMTLSRNMIEVLCAIRDGYPNDYTGDSKLSRSASGRFVGVGHSLMRRGLVYHIPWNGPLTPELQRSGNYGWKLSEAGAKTCELLVVAGLIDAPAAKPRTRAA